MSPRLGAYGDPVARTPHIDMLAEEGVRYTQVFATTGVCAPARSGLITGMYPISIGTHHMRTTSDVPGLPKYLAVPPPEVKTFTEYLRSAGYYTTNNAKTDYQFGTPFTAWDESSHEAHWRDRAPGQPFFAVFNSARTHESRVWPDSTEQRTTPREAVTVPPYYPDTPTVREDLARHYDNIARMDQWVGDILDELEKDGLADSTIVFFFSDHGDGLPRAKRWPYDAGIHVPLIIRFPNALLPPEYEPGDVEDRLISFVDFGPTVLSLAGVPVPDHMQGSPFMGSQEGEPRDYVFAHRDRVGHLSDRVRAVRDDRFKYLRNYMPDSAYVRPLGYRDNLPMMREMMSLHREGKLTGTESVWFSDRPEEELYDLEADPHEVHNLAADPDYEAVLRRMRRVLTAWLDDVGDLGQTREIDMIRDMWPDLKQPATRPPTAEPAGGAFSDSLVVTLASATEGASIGYTYDGDAADPVWQLYTGPLTLRRSTVLRTKAIRYGYRESVESHFSFEVRRPPAP